MFKMITLILQGIEGFILDLPTGTTTPHELISILFCNSKICNPAEMLHYTENWFSKSIDTYLDHALLHDEYSYVHHPELLNLTPLESVFKVIAATIPKEYDSIEEAIETANELNQDFDLEDPVITKEGILKDNQSQCKSLLGRLEVEIDRHLDTLEYLKGVKFPDRSIKNREYRRVFDETAGKVYEVITGRPCPKSVN